MFAVVSVCVAQKYQEKYLSRKCWYIFSVEFIYTTRKTSQKSALFVKLNFLINGRFGVCVSVPERWKYRFNWMKSKFGEKMKWEKSRPLKINHLKCEMRRFESRIEVEFLNSPLYARFAVSISFFSRYVCFFYLQCDCNWTIIPSTLLLLHWNGEMSESAIKKVKVYCITSFQKKTNLKS